MNNAQKTPLARSLPLFARQVSLDQIAQQGLCIPGHVVAVENAIVTVAFEVTGLTLPQVTMPVASPKYIRLPIQIDDKGVAVPASYYLGAISGLGSTSATPDVLQGNLSALFWVPLSNAGFSVVPSGLVFDNAAVTAVQNFSVGNGWTGTFTDLSGQVLTVQNGIIINGE